ncbi:hypothetical protein FACS18945_5560 [Bacteroidia bacterium]|nr:hypothetical protein FACS18945_5560 [Bacteroidia bacterium]
MADGIAINKADGSNIEKANLAKAQIQNALHLFPKPESGWSPQTLTCSAVTQAGIAEIWEMIEKYVDFTQKNGYFAHRRNEQSKYWLYESINESLKSSFYNNVKIQNLLPEYERKILNNEISSFIAAKELINLNKNSDRK